MKKQLKKLKKILWDNNEDLKYLFTVGVPSGILMILLSQCKFMGEIY